MTPEEDAFIGGIEMAMDWNLAISEEDLKRFFELKKGGTKNMCKIEFELLDNSPLQMAYVICKYYKHCYLEEESALIDLEELVKHINAHVEAVRLAGGVMNDD